MNIHVEIEMTNLKDLQFHKRHTAKNSALGRELGKTPRRQFFKQSPQDELKLCGQKGRWTITLSGGMCKKLEEDGTHAFRLSSRKTIVK